MSLTSQSNTRDHQKVSCFSSLLPLKIQDAGLTLFAPLSLSANVLRQQKTCRYITVSTFALDMAEGFFKLFDIFFQIECKPLGHRLIDEDALCKWRQAEVPTPILPWMIIIISTCSTLNFSQFIPTIAKSQEGKGISKYKFSKKVSECCTWRCCCNLPNSMSRGTDELKRPAVNV